MAGKHLVRRNYATVTLLDVWSYKATNYIVVVGQRAKSGLNFWPVTRLKVYDLPTRPDPTVERFVDKTPCQELQATFKIGLCLTQRSTASGRQNTHEVGL